MEEAIEQIESVEIEAEYTLEHAAKCSSCSETVRNLQVVRLLRTKVNFTSNLPRRGFAILCPACGVIVSANIGTRML